MSRFIRLLTVGSTFVVALTTGLTTASGSVDFPVGRAAPPMVESEPNDTAPEADGPIPAGGYTATRATPDDHDMFVLRLQPQRQVTMTMRRVSGCRYSVNSNPTSFRLTRSDGRTEINFSNWSSQIYSHSWTTPAVAVEYIGDISGDYWWEGNQCTVNIEVTPADAVIEGDMPAPAPRDAVVTPVDIIENKPFTTTITGHAYSGDTLRYWYAKAGDTCTSSRQAEVTKAAVPVGTFTVPLTMTAGDAGYATVCLRLRNRDTNLIQDMVAPAPIVVRGARPVSITSKKIRLDSQRNAALPLRCDLPSGEVCGVNLTIKTKAGAPVAELEATISSGQTKKIKFQVPASVARAVLKSGAVRATATGTVVRGDLGDIDARTIHLLLLPPRG